MALMPPETVPAPQPRGIRYGLFTVANGPLELAVHGRGGGVQYEPVSCGQAHTYPIECDDSPPEMVFDPGTGTVAFEPFLVYGSLTCGSAGKTQADLRAEVTRNLTSGEQTQAETAMAALLTAGATGLGAATLVVDAVSQLEQWIHGTADYGHVATLHASVGVAAWAADAGLVVQDGPVKRTPFGSVWSFGGGYPDDIIWVSGQPTVWRSPDIDVPPLDQVLDRATNQYSIVASREYVVGYDCAAASVTLGA